MRTNTRSKRLAPWRQNIKKSGAAKDFYTVLYNYAIYFGSLDHSVTTFASKTEEQQLTCRVLSLRPFRKMGKLTKLLYFVTTSETETISTDA